MNVCAIVLDYRRADLTRRCVDSLANQVDPVVVVDNGGDTGAAERLQAQLARHLSGTALPRVDVLRPARNLGFAAGVNFALRSLAGATWDAVLLVNNDATLGPGSVGDMVEVLRRHDGRAIVAPDRSLEGLGSRLWYQPALGLITRRPVPGSFAYLSGTCLLIPRAFAVGPLFDEDFFMYGEDAALASRLRGERVALALAPRAQMSHLGNASAPPGGFFYEYHMARAHLLLAQKLAASPLQRTWWRFLRLATLGLRGAWRAVRQRSSVPLAALAAAWRGTRAVPPPREQPDEAE